MARVHKYSRSLTTFDRGHKIRPCAQFPFARVQVALTVSKDTSCRGRGLDAAIAANPKELGYGY